MRRCFTCRALVVLRIHVVAAIRNIMLNIDSIFISNFKRFFLPGNIIKSRLVTYEMQSLLSDLSLERTGHTSCNKSGFKNITPLITGG